MKKDSIIDYSSCILFNVFGPLIRSLPLNMSLFFGRRLGDLFYYFDAKHKAIVYANIKTALGNKLSISGLNSVVRNFYRAFGQNIIEIFFIPLVDKEYVNKYISFEGLEHISEGFKKGKGVILLGMHEGSWELSNIISAYLGFSFSLFVRIQRYPHFDKLLNSYRSHKGCRLIQRQNQLREMIRVLKENRAIGMSLDQGGKSGTLVDFFGKEASMSTGAVKVALKYDCAIIPVFYRRCRGPYLKVIIHPPFEIRKTADPQRDIRDNLQELVYIFQKNISMYPHEYLWSYKIWKYTKERDILILSDGKTGHLRQSQSVCRIIKDYFENKGMSVNIYTQEVKFLPEPQVGLPEVRRDKNTLHRFIFLLWASLAGRYNCQGPLRCLRRILKSDVYAALLRLRPDVVISCGSSLSAVNFVLSRENLSKSVVIMRPSFLSIKKFGLVIMSRHDRPPKKKNVLTIEGSLNLIKGAYLKEQSDRLIQRFNLEPPPARSYIGVLIGGDTRGFSLTCEAVSEVIKQVKYASGELNLDILITTSRRTSGEIEGLVKKEFIGYPACKVLVIANEKNIPEAVGGILGLSKIIVTSPESISMISEAVSSRKYVLVFNSFGGAGKRHMGFLEYFRKQKFIYLVDACDLAKKIQEVCLNRPEAYAPDDNVLVADAIKRIL